MNQSTISMAPSAERTGKMVPIGALLPELLRRYDLWWQPEQTLTPLEGREATFVKAHGLVVQSAFGPGIHCVKT